MTETPARQPMLAGTRMYPIPEQPVLTPAFAAP
jgi:hypothetical protein